MAKFSEHEKRDAPTLTKLLFNRLRRQPRLYNRLRYASARFTTRHDIRVRDGNAIGINVSGENGGIWSQGGIHVC